MLSTFREETVAGFACKNKLKPFCFFGMTGRRGAQTLPYSKVKTKTSKRRRSQLRDFLSTNIFCIGIIVSLGVFIVVVLRYGIPIPPSTRPQNSSYLSFSRRKSSPLQRSTYSPVDISTKGLYDKIQFLDVDGGPWKQGWVVKYKGDEWNNEKLKVFVVPHSHNDPGWKLTVGEYYMRQSRHYIGYHRRDSFKSNFTPEPIPCLMTAYVVV